MARSTTDRKAQQWRQRFLRFEKSRQSISAFCRAEGVSAPSFYLWRKRLGATPAVRPSTRPASEGFRPVRLLPAASLTARLPGGTQFVVPMSDPEGLRTVIDAVARVDAHLPREEVTLEADEEVTHCPLHGPRKPIGYDRQETLVFQRPKLTVRVTLIPKFACEGHAECGVKEPPRPEGLVEGNRYDTSVAAEIITNKSGYHLPIYRQQDQFAGSGWTPARSTLLNILVAAAACVKPFVGYLRDEVLAGGRLGTDDTRTTLLLPAEIPKAIEGDAKSQRIHEVFTEARAEGKPSVSGRMWAYRGLTVPINVFDFTVSRHRDGPDEFLVASNFTGTILADCYSGYRCISLRSDARIVRAACNAHARRKLFDARANHPLLASRFLAMYQELYDIEDRGKTLSCADRQSLRQSESRPVWQRLRELLDGQECAKLLPKDKFTEAVGYLRNQWSELQVYLGDGRLPIDNKIASYYTSLAG